ncbi:4'-phosphopantetheinyl transferase superfamily protein [Paenibacillus sp. FSL M7-1455]|uniref:4'-phosphopantetheinyl transferase family protein n=1 Tax=Paenibacillus sp. FSL M7-1455 TaxID=2975316 RepID=UPI0030F5A991
MKRIATIYAVNLNDWREGAGADMQRLLAFLPDEARSRAARHRSERDAERVIVSDALKRVTACLEKGLRLRNVEFARDGYGKPFLAGVPDYYFNVSHAKDWVVCAVGAGGPIGIDVEHIGRAEEEAAELCFTPRELTEWRRQPAERRDAFFFELWTLKESYSKAVGKGLSIGLSKLETVRHPSGIRIVHQGRIDPELHLQVVPFDPAYKLSVCMPLEEQAVVVRRFSPGGLLAALQSCSEAGDSGRGGAFPMITYGNSHNFGI